MEKKIYLLVALMATVVMSGCKSDATKRAECEEACEMLADEWLNERLTAGNKAFLTNIFELMKEYGQAEDYKTFKHEAGDVSDAEFEQQLRKDFRELSAVSGDSRYEILNGKELDSTFVAFCYYGDLCGYGYPYPSVKELLEIKTSQMVIRDSLVSYLKEDIFTGRDSAELIKNVREVDFGPSWRFDSWTQDLKKYKYLAFVHLEYYFPPILADKGSFEGGMACARLSVFRIADKKCLLENKRIFAVSSDELEGGLYTTVTINGKPTGSAPSDDKRIISNLQGRLNHEAVLQISKCGIPLVERE